MICPSCSNKKTYVIETRQMKEIHRRRYKCSCGDKFTTYELVADDDILRRRMGGNLKPEIKLITAALKIKRRKKKPIKAIPIPEPVVLSESNFTANDYATKLLNRGK